MHHNTNHLIPLQEQFRNNPNVSGPVRPESYTLMYTRAVMGLAGARTDPAECEPSVEELGGGDDGDDDDGPIDAETALPPEEERDLLQRLANKHFYR